MCMRKIIFGIFAHPDDEAFGPSGTLLQETRAGTELHLLTLTLGDAGTNPDNYPNLGKIRHEEWQAAGKLMGATSVHFLGFKDGQLCNQSMIDAGHKIVNHVLQLVNSDEEAEIEFMTIDLNGVTGHIDHIVAARAASWAFYELKKHDTRMTRIRYICLPLSDLPSQNTNWIFMEQGRREDEIGQIVDATHLQQEIREIIHTHHTQRGDAASLLARQGDSLGMNYFVVKD